MNGKKILGGFRSQLLIQTLIGCVATLDWLCPTSAARADIRVLHTYGNLLGQEVTSVIAVNQSKLLPLLPSGYTIVPASSVGFGNSAQEVVVIANVRDIARVIDNREPLNRNYQNWGLDLRAEAPT